MTASPQIVRQARTLLGFCVDEDGMIDGTKTRHVVSSLVRVKMPYPVQTLRYLRQLLEQLDAQQRAVVTSPSALPAAVQKSVMRKIKAAHPRTAYFLWEIDPGLLGGMVIQAGDTRYDVSVAGQLRRIVERV